MGVGEARGFSLDLSISGCPISQPRPRMSTRGGRVIVYNPTSRAKKIIADKIKEELLQTGILLDTSAQVFHSLVSVTATFGVSNNSKDLDNMLKFILDALEDAGVYGNDRLVCKIVATKVQSEVGFTKMTLSTAMMDVVTMMGAATI